MNASTKTPDQLPVSTGATSTPGAVHDSLVLTARFLPIVAPFVSISDPRYYLTGINVRPLASGGVTICGCNGHVLGVYYDPDGVCHQEVTLSVSREVLAACGAGIDDERTVVMRNGRLTVLDKFGEDVCIQAGNPVLDSTIPYPRIETVVPDAVDLRRGLMACVSGTLLTKLISAAASARRALSLPRCLRGLDGLAFFNVNGDVDKCTVGRLDFAPEFLAIIMPMRPLHDISQPLPAWLCAERDAA